MRESLRGILGDPNATTEEITLAMREAVRLALVEHKRRGESIVVWDREKNQTVILGPDQIEVEMTPVDVPAAATEPVSHAS